MKAPAAHIVALIFTSFVPFVVQDFQPRRTQGCTKETAAQQGVLSHKSQVSEVI